MESQRELNEAEQFQEDMIRCRGIEFARLGMKVEVNGKEGTIQGMNANANLNVLFPGQAGVRNCHPTWKVKYFNEQGEVIADFDECGCVFRPDRQASECA